MRERGGRPVRGQRPLLPVHRVLQERFASAIILTGKFQA